MPASVTGIRLLQMYASGLYYRVLANDAYSSSACLHPHVYVYHLSMQYCVVLRPFSFPKVQRVVSTSLSHHACKFVMKSRIFPCLSPQRSRQYSADLTRLRIYKLCTQYNIIMLCKFSQNTHTNSYVYIIIMLINEQGLYSGRQGAMCTSEVKKGFEGMLINITVCVFVSMLCFLQHPRDIYHNLTLSTYQGNNNSAYGWLWEGDNLLFVFQFQIKIKSPSYRYTHEMETLISQQVQHDVKNRGSALISLGNLRSVKRGNPNTLHLVHIHYISTMEFAT